MRKTFVRSPYNYDVDAASTESGLDCSGEPSMTKQSYAEEADINVLVRRFGILDAAPAVPFPEMDFTGAVDYHTALNMVRGAEEAFGDLPALVRQRFDNDPGKLLQFVTQDENRDEAVKLGLVNAPPVRQDAAPAAPVTPPATPPA